jgi:hypothetical protein
MPPKQDAKLKSKADAPGITPLLDALFPVWNDAFAAPDKDAASPGEFRFVW